MSVLVAMYQLQDQPCELNWLNSLSKVATTIVVNDLSNISAWIQKQTFRLLVVLTREQALPLSWSPFEYGISIPIMILSGLATHNSQAIESFIDAFDPPECKEEAEVTPRFQESLDFIDQHLCELELNLEMVASSVFVSKCHYSRMFHKQLGIGFKEYVMNQRIKIAKVLLQKGEPVTEVCYAVGYGDLTHFGRVFKRLVGVNPSVYRNEKGKLPHGVMT